MPLKIEQINLSELEYLEKEFLSLIRECKKLKNRIVRCQEVCWISSYLIKNSILHGHKKDIFLERVPWSKNWIISLRNK